MARVLKTRSLYLLVFFITLFSFSCTSFKGNEKVAQETAKDTINDGRELHASIEFEEDFFDFGRLKQGEVISHIFTFTNTGNIPLIIHEIIPSCGCTKTEPSAEIIKPNQQATLEVVFDSRGWYGSQFKSVTIVSNALTSQRSLTIKANIVP